MKDGLAVGFQKPNQWVDYEVELGAWPLSAAPTVGPASVGGTRGGRYIYLKDSNLVIATFNVAMGGSGFNVGSGTWLFKLPIPAKAQYGGAGNQNLAGVDRFLGFGHVAKGFGETPQVPIHFMVADFASNPNSFQTGTNARQQWTQAFCPYYRFSGTGTVPVTASSVAVTFPVTLQAAPANSADIIVEMTNNAGAIRGTGTATTATTAVTFANALSFTPNAEDIVVQWTANPSGSTKGMAPWITSISTTGFTINLAAAPSTSATFTYKVSPSGPQTWITNVSTTGFTLNLASAPQTAATFDWKFVGDVSLLVGASQPWAIGAYDSVKASLVYEADSAT